ncbi:hypothetical protein FGW37_18950 [Streptomyces rectiverticillatus]|uniref:hypothetical protein n=1 Tax=Streptomyces rectiverticillatus TaxID=173860 RepID=UPI0015C32B13|nr:hypothetical protein [Streptomyces rectiverticillatus]QLE73384.1 hypothetical protein FGW37_18950 [Streptomyces rectiverticillatus]
MKRTLLTAAATSLLAFAALAPDAGPSPAPAEERAAVSAEQGEHPPVLKLPATPSCRNCGGPTDTSWGGTTGRQL